MKTRLLLPMILVATACSSSGGNTTNAEDAGVGTTPADTSAVTDVLDMTDTAVIEEVASADVAAPPQDLVASPDSTDDAGESPDTTVQDPDGTQGAPDTEASDSGADTQAAPELLTTSHSFDTTDGKTLTALLHVRSDLAASAPGVVLIHQFTSNKLQWDAYVPSLAGAGFAVMAFDLRGHGDSSAQNGALSDLLTDPTQAPLDVQTALAWFKANAPVDSQRIAVVGTSIGANLACVAMANAYGVKLAVAVSARQSAVESLAGKTGLSFASLYCLATANDGGGAQATTCQSFAPASGDPKATVIIPASSAHGSGLLSSFPDAWAAVVTFLIAEL